MLLKQSWSVRDRRRAGHSVTVFFFNGFSRNTSPVVQQLLRGAWAKLLRDYVITTRVTQDFFPEGDVANVGHGVGCRFGSRRVRRYDNDVPSIISCTTAQREDAKQRSWVGELFVN